MRLLLALLLLSFEAGAATYYVTPTGAGATNGTSLANAFAGWSDIPGNTFVAGDVLCVVGELNSDTTMSFTDAGSAGNPIVIAGDCTEGAGILDGNNTASPVLKLGEAGLAASYVRVRGLTVRDSNPDTAVGECIRDSSLGAGGGYNEFIDLTVTDCGLYGLTMQKPSPTVDGGEYLYCGRTCIHVNDLAVNPTIRNVTLHHINPNTTLGDGIAIIDTPSASNVLIENNACYWDYAGKEKQCFIVGVSSGEVIIRENVFVNRAGTTTNHAISVTAATNAYVERNYCDGFNACVTHFSQATEGVDGAMYVRSNVAKGSQYAALITTTVGTPTFYIDNNSGAGLVNGLRATSSVAHNIFARNNAFRLDGTSGGDALYVGSNANSYTGSNNNFGPDAATFIENYECGGSTYNTAAAYVAACTQEAGTTSADPAFLGGTSPTTAEGFRPNCATTPLKDAGTYVGQIQDYTGRFFVQPVDIGAFACQGGTYRPSATARASKSARAAKSARASASARP